ncbi:phage antirepressor Ant [Clostridiaceae bacterium 14S0207]|nr:phage antirepressor Ant [Clostridiaceae bacterium 14S0207]
MSSLVKILNQGGKLVVTSRQISENFNKRHGDVLEKIDNLIKEMNSTEKSVQYFIEDSYKDNSGRSNKAYLLTRDGFSLLVMGFTGSIALQWKLKYIEAFNKIEQMLKEQKQLSPMDQLRLQYQVLEEHQEKLTTIESKVINLENHMTIDYGEQLILQELAKSKAIQEMGGKDTCCYKDRSLRSKVFSGVWKDFKDYLAVNSYRNTPKKDFGKAKEYLKDWKAQGKLLREIEERNSQIALEEVACTK